jgi:hypothetical protein
MRIMSFAKRWKKLEKPQFSTFRYPRKDTDWHDGETVQVFLLNRSPHRVFLGTAQIVAKNLRHLFVTKDPIPSGRGRVTEREANADGFENLEEMEKFMIRYYGKDYSPDFNKLTLKWISR